MAISTIADQPFPGTLRKDPFGPDALDEAATPLDRFLGLLALIDRTVLPREITVDSAAAPFSLDVVGQRLRFLPRRQHNYATDDALSAEAARAYRLLNKRAPVARKAMDDLVPAREAILRCAARALWAFSRADISQNRFSAAAHGEVSGVEFTALELYRAARDQTVPAAPGPVPVFYQLMKPRALTGWRASRSGWVHDWPAADDSKQALRTLSEIARGARAYSAWLESTEFVGEPSVSFLSGSGHKVIRCVVADANEVAHLEISPTAWAGALQNWEMTCADHAGITGAEPADG